MKKFSFFLMVVIVLVSLVGCGNNYNVDESQSLESYEMEDVVEQNVFEDNTNDEEEYFSVLESTQNNSLRFNMSFDDFINNYNYYANKLDRNSDTAMGLITIGGFELNETDFVLATTDEDYKGVLCEVYTYSLNTSNYPTNCPMTLQVVVERNSHLISYVSILMSANNQTSYLRKMATNMHMIALQALTSSDDVGYYSEMVDNKNNYGVMAMYKKGLQISLSSYSDVDELRIYPITKEQWKTAPGLKDIPID